MSDTPENRSQEEVQALKDALERFCEFEVETNHEGIFSVESIFTLVCDAALKGGFTTEDLFNSLVAAIKYNQAASFDSVTCRVFDVLQEYAEETKKHQKKDEMDKIPRLRQEFAKSIADKDNSLASFEHGISEISMLLNEFAINADNFQLLFNVMYWDWTEKRGSIDPGELDRISLEYSRFGEAQEAVIQENINSAQEWAQSLKDGEVSPRQALSLAKFECEMIVDEQERLGEAPTNFG